MIHNTFILLVNWLHMDIKTQKDINFKCVLQAFQIQLFEGLQKIIFFLIHNSMIEFIQKSEM